MRGAGGSRAPPLCLVDSPKSNPHPQESPLGHPPLAQPVLAPNQTNGFDDLHVNTVFVYTLLIVASCSLLVFLCFLLFVCNSVVCCALIVNCLPSIFNEVTVLIHSSRHYR